MVRHESNLFRWWCVFWVNTTSSNGWQYLFMSNDRILVRLREGYKVGSKHCSEKTNAKEVVVGNYRRSVIKRNVVWSGSKWPFNDLWNKLFTVLVGCAVVWRKLAFTYHVERLFTCMIGFYVYMIGVWS